MEILPDPIATDAVEALAHGIIQCYTDTTNAIIPEDLLGGGDHQEDTTRQYRQAFRRRNQNGEELPREIILKMITWKRLCRPTPKRWL